jgi:glycosyltransferase involved in cell wall biosynthesis
VDSVQGGDGLRIDVSYPEMCLLPGRSFGETWDDPRTGSEVAWRRIAEELKALGHDVDRVHGPRWVGTDVSIAINDPRLLKNAPGLRVCEFLLNEFSFCNQEPFDDYTDLYISPSEAHRQKAIGDWGAPDASKWQVNHLGCDPDTPEGRRNLHGADGLGRRIPGRVVYCSSPDRGLHRVLEAWPAIKRGVPHATLKVFYRLEKWFRDFDQTPYYPPIEKLRARALWCEEALKRLSGPEWGIEIRDSVSHDEMMRELAMAEVVAFPCETVSWSEGFSCATMEACAAEACPVITDCDALGTVYADLDPIPVGLWDVWRDRVIQMLKDPEVRAHYNARARALAERNTWKKHVEKLDATIREKLGR